MSIGRVISLIGAAVIIAAVVAAIAIQPPGMVRQRKLDERRVDDLRAFQSNLFDCWRQHDKLPQDINEMIKLGFYEDVHLADPETGAPYIYEKTGEDTYKLCATFALATMTAEECMKTNQCASYRHGEWRHNKGFYCYTMKMVTKKK